MSGQMERSSRSTSRAIGSRISAALLAVAMLFGGVSLPAVGTALANDRFPAGTNGRVHYDHYRDRGDDRWRHRDRRPQRWNDRRSDRRDRGTRNSVIIRNGGDGGASGGTYSGNVTSYRDRGNGTYFHIERERDYGAPIGREPARNAGPRVISPGGASACVDESGVCVIRPGR
jgi:hypothetical protein